MRRVFTALLLLLSLESAAPQEVMARWREQDQEGAFRTFLQALDKIPFQASTPSSEERLLFHEALKEYLEGAPDPQETARTLIQKYASVVEQHPGYLQLQLLLATAYANLGKFEEFFTHFYPAYRAYPHHYLAYKTRAVLHIKLYERCRHLDEREKERSAIYANVQQAIEQFPEDIGLYKLWLLFADEKKRGQEVEACLNKILESPMIISRSDLSFFAQQTLEARQYDLTQRLIDKAHRWYPYSRSLESAQQALDNRGSCKTRFGGQIR